MVDIALEVEDGAEYALSLDDDVGMALSLGDVFVNGGRSYEGPYEVTPSRHVQVLPTSGRKMDDDVTVNPIPQNYGLVTWDGAVLTVS